jgi:hypothetical protein
MSHYAGVDVSDKCTHVCAVDESGRITELHGVIAGASRPRHDLRVS